MIITERVTINNTEFIHTYSDSGRMVHGGSPEADYMEAYDPVNFNRTYVEGDLIPEDYNVFEPGVADWVE